MRIAEILVSLVSLSAILSGCLCSSKHRRTDQCLSIIPSAHAAPVPAEPQEEFTLTYRRLKPAAPKPVLPVSSTADTVHQTPLLAFTGLLVIWLLYRFHLAARPVERSIEFDDRDLALIGMASDALGDFWRRHNTKYSPKITPFPPTD